MRKLLIILPLCGLCFQLAAQPGFSRYEKNLMYEAEIYFYQEDYYYASQLYKELYNAHPENPEVNYRLGACYYNIYGQTHRSRDYLERAVEADVTEAYHVLAKLNHREERFDEALSLMEKYRERPERLASKAEIDRFMEMNETARKLMSSPVQAEIVNAGPEINSEAADYAPLITPDGNKIFFTSRRYNPEFPEKDPWDRPFEDIYLAERKEKDWTTAKALPDPVNTKRHDATVGISNNGEVLLVYRSDRVDYGGDLYLTQIREDEWEEPEKLENKINSSHLESSASMSNDGDVLYFSSDRPGGYGGKDIYRVKKLPDGEWSMPQNLGPVVNTQFDEDAPYASPDGKLLFFSSRGHETMGGFDIFISREKDDGFWSFPENMGYPINTVQDDIHFTMSGSGTAYYSSSRKEGYGRHDIYEIRFRSPERNLVVVEGVVQNDGEEAVGDAKIIVLEKSSGTTQGIYRAQSGTGKFIMALQPEQQYELIVEAPGYNCERMVKEFPRQKEHKSQSHRIEVLLQHK